MRACKKGHIGDIDWYAFAHGGATSCRRPLWIDERGTSGDLSEVWVRCECGQAERPIIDAIKLPTNPLGHCDGSRPWLGPFMKEPCGDLNRLLIRTASNAYFPQTMSVISLPDRNETVAEAVDQVWEHYLQYVVDLDELIKERKRKPPVKAASSSFVARRSTPGFTGPRSSGEAVSSRRDSNAGSRTTRASVTSSAFPLFCSIRCRTS